ncbi:MAG: histidine kinase [Lewinellaceae bacterium]|nr:histidine kinase [Lewinellaceae bacterium]
MPKLLQILSILLLACPFAAAQQPYFKNYQVRDGLPSNNVYFVFQDSKNYIWLCTDVGVSRFDGARFTNYTTADGLTDNEVFTCFEDRAGRLWFATLNGKPCFFQDGKMHNESDVPLLRGCSLGDLVLHIFEDKKGQIVFASSNLLGRLDFEKNAITMDTFPDVVMQAWPNADGSIGLLLNGDVGFFQDKKFAQTTSLPSATKPIKLGFSGDTVFISDIHGLLVYNTLTQKLITSFSYPANMGEAIAVLPTNQRLWVGCRNGAYRFDPSSHSFQQAYLTNSQVSGILEDNEGGWWFSTLDNGLFYTPAPEILQILDPAGNSPGHVTSLSAAPDGQLWVGLMNNAYGVLKNGKLEVFHHFPQGLTPRAIGMIRHLADGSTLVSGKAGSLLLKDGQHQFFYLRSTDTNMDREGNLWAGLTGLYRVQSNKVRHFGSYASKLDEQDIGEFFKLFPPEKLSDQRVDRIVFDETNTAWLASPNGLFFYKNEKMGHAVLAHAIRDLLFDEKTKTLWALTEANGLFALKNGQTLDSIRIAIPGQNDKICRSFYQDEKGNFWIATASGLFKVEGSPGHLQLLDFSNVHGLGAEKLNAVAVIGEQVFLGKDNGLVAVPLSIFSKKLSPPPIYLKKLKVNEQVRAFAQQLALGFGENSLSFSFEGLSFKDYKNLRYRYRLQGHDIDWHTTSSEVVEYASLRPGNYKFEVLAVNSSNVESMAAAVLDFSIARPFWMKWWFIVLSIFAAAGFVFFWVKHRERKLRRKFEMRQRLMESENERLELQTKNADLKMLALRLQMNPHFIFNALNTIKGYYGQEKFTQANSYIAKFARLLRLNLDYSDSFIPLDQEMELLKIYLQLSQIRYPDKIKFNITAEPELNTSGVLIPSMVVQPFVENAVIHGIVGKAGTGHIAVHFSKNGDEICATISDDGIGRKAAAAKSKLRDPHKPLATAITEERLQLLRKNGAQAVSINDLYNGKGEAAGTEVVVLLPVERVRG